MWKNFVLAAAPTIAGSAWTQDVDDSNDDSVSDESTDDADAIVVGDDGVFEFGPGFIEGEIDRPEAVYVLTPTDVDPGPLRYSEVDAELADGAAPAAPADSEAAAPGDEEAETAEDAPAAEE